MGKGKKQKDGDKLPLQKASLGGKKKKDKEKVQPRNEGTERAKADTLGRI